MSSDADFLGLVPGDSPGTFTFEVLDHLARHDGHLYGGTAIGVSIAAAELISQRSAVWMTTQFVATAPPGERVSVVAEVLAPGRRTNQIRVTGTDSNGATMFASLGATGMYAPSGISGDYERPPVVDSPEDSRPVGPFEEMLRNAGVDVDLSGMNEARGFTRVIEYRQPRIHQHPDPGPGRICSWVRRRDGVPPTAAIAAFMADTVPISIGQAAGQLMVGLSLDNSIRIGEFESSEWVLLDMRPNMAVGNYGHGSVHIWSESGHLLATASQTAAMSRFDPAVLFPESD